MLLFFNFDCRFGFLVKNCCSKVFYFCYILKIAKVTAVLVFLANRYTLAKRHMAAQKRGMAAGKTWRTASIYAMAARKTWHGGVKTGRGGVKKRRNTTLVSVERTKKTVYFRHISFITFDKQ